MPACHILRLNVFLLLNQEENLFAEGEVSGYSRAEETKTSHNKPTSLLPFQGPEKAGRHP